MDNHGEGQIYSPPNKDHDDNKSPDTEIPPEKGIKPMDEQSVEMNNQSEQNLRNGEADFSGKNEGSASPSESSSVDSEDDYLDETPTNKVFFQERELRNTSERRLDDTQVEYIELTEFGRYLDCEASGSNLFVADQSSKSRVEQAMEKLKLVEKFQENGQYDEALRCCDSAFRRLDLSQDTINLRMKFCSNIMQLYFLKGNIDAVLNMYFDHCEDVLEFVSDPKVIQSIMDMHTLCMKKLENERR